jgi:hypothetical protein
MIQRITLLLEKSEMDALRRAAREEMRKPRDHARYLLREVLCEPSTEQNKSGADAYQAHGAALATTPLHQPV